jgi:sulfur carrier protein ThiS
MTDRNNLPLPVTLILRGKEHYTAADITVAQALKRIGLTVDGYLAVRNGDLITEDQFVRAGDVIRIVPVISGGSGYAL